MRTRSCDICEKTIGEEKLEITMHEKGFMGFKNFDLCQKCAEPVMKFLKAKKLIKLDKK